MAGKHQSALRADRRPDASNFTNGDLPTATYVADDPAPPAPPALAKPKNLALTAYSTRGAQAGMAMIAATWDMASFGGTADSFNVQVATTATFDDGTAQTYVATQESIALENLHANVTYYVRVQAVYRTIVGPFCDAASILTPIDLTPPDPVSAVVWSWLADGNLTISYTPPTGENYKEAEVRVWSSSAKTLLLHTLYGRTDVTYTAAMNIAEGGPFTTLYVEVYSRSWVNVYGAVALPSSNPFKAKPATVTGLTSSWAGDAGLAGADVTISWSYQNDAVRWLLSIDGQARSLSATSYTYTLATNRTEHSNLADPTLAIQVVAVDGLGQTSATPAIINPVNAKPPATSVSIAAGPSTIGVAITGSLAADLKDYITRIVLGGTTVATFRTPGSSAIYDLSTYGKGSYQIGISVADQFEQISAETLSAAVDIEPLTLADLRADATYEDDMGTASATLDALKDANTATGGVTYL